MAAMEEALLKRVLPHSVEAEQSVIGSMLIDREAIVVAAGILHGEDFYGKQYGIVFEAMTELNDEGRPVDIVTLQDRLREKDVPPEISSLEFVRDLITAVPTSANVRYYAEIVAEKATLRRLIRLNEEIANICYAGKDSLEVILENTEKKIFELIQKRNSSDYVPIREVVLNAMDKIEAASRNKGVVTGIPTNLNGVVVFAQYSPTESSLCQSFVYLTTRITSTLSSSSGFGCPNTRKLYSSPA